MCERTHCHASSNSGYIIIVYVYMYVYACIHIYVYIYRFYKNVSCMFRYHPWLGRFLIAILHTDEESLARPRTASGKMTARDNLRKRSRTIGIMSGVLTIFFSELNCHQCPLLSLHTESLLRKRNASLSLSLISQRKADASRKRII